MMCGVQAARSPPSKTAWSAPKANPHTCVLHFNPYRNLFGNVRPDYFAAITDAYIVYPWEINRGMEGSLLPPMPSN